MARTRRGSRFAAAREHWTSPLQRGLMPPSDGHCTMTRAGTSFPQSAFDTMTTFKPALAVSLLLVMTTVGCGDNQDEQAAQAFYDQVIAAPYLDWASPGPFARYQDSHTSHGDQVRVYMNDEMEALHIDLDQCLAEK